MGLVEADATRVAGCLPRLWLCVPALTMTAASGALIGCKPSSAAGGSCGRTHWAVVADGASRTLARIGDELVQGLRWVRLLGRNLSQGQKTHHVDVCKSIVRTRYHHVGVIRLDLGQV